MSAQSSEMVLLLGPADAGRPVSGNEFARARFARPWRYERGRGRLVVMSPNGEEHDDAVEPWRDRLVAYKLAHPDVVQKVVSEAWVRIDDEDRIGDLGVYLVSDRRLQKRPERIPELMYEVVSPGRESRERDHVEKRDEYLRAGVLEYVVIDRFERRVTVFAPAAAGHAERVLAQGDTYTSPLLPGLAIPLSEVI